MAFAISLSNTSYPRVPSAAIHPLWSLRTAASQFGFSRGFAKVSHLPVVFDSSSSAAAASSLSSSSSSPETAAVEERPLEILEHPVAASPWRKMPVITKFLSRLFFGGDDGCEEYCFPGSNLSFAEGFPSSKPKGLSPAGLMCSCAAFTPSSRSFMAAAAAAKEVPVLDFVAAAITLTGALSILQFFDELAKRDLLEKKLSRKLVHILSGLVFMLFWPLFSMAPYAKYMAAFAPAANGLRMIGLGLGLLKNDALVKAMSREGGRRELLKGPVYYALTITLITLCFWRNSPVGAVAVANLCAGDGFADIVGRKYGTKKLPYNNSKTFIGSLAFFAFASLASMGYTAYFAAFGYFEATWRMYLATMVVSLSAAFAESLPLPLDDNFTVPFVAVAVGMLLLPY
jgi:farnesol kinase